MPRILTTLLVFLHSVGLAAPLKINDEFSHKVRSAIQTANSSALVACFRAKADLVIDSDHVFITQIDGDHAEQILKNFFRSYPPTSFEYTYEGNSDAETKYFVGLYKSNTKNYIVYLLVKNNGIDTIQFRENK